MGIGAFWKAYSLFSNAVLPLAILFALTLSFGCSQAQKKADVTIINGNEPESLDPAISTSVADNRIIHALFEGLCRLDPKTAKAIPALAETWDISSDGRTYTFHLRTNAFWSTGEPITTADVVYSWIRVLKPETASEYAGQLYYVKNCEAFNIGKLKDPSQLGFKAIDDHTLQVELVGPRRFSSISVAFLRWRWCRAGGLKNMAIAGF